MSNPRGQHTGTDIKQHRQAVHRRPRDANAHALLGLALLKQGHLEEGSASLLRALALDPKMGELHAVLAPALLEQKRHDEAVAAYHAALRFQDGTDLHQGLSDSLRALGRLEEAEVSARRAVELAPGVASFLITLAATQHAQGKLDEAAETLRNALALDPSQVEVRQDLADLLLRLKRYPEAAALYQDLINDDPGHVHAHIGLGLSFHNQRQFPDALRCFGRAEALAPDDTSVLTRIASSLRASGEVGAALSILRRAQAQAPDDPEVLSTLVNTCFTLGEWEEALRLARRGLELRPMPATHSVMLFILSHCTSDAEELTREHFAFGERWEPALQALRQPHTNEADAQRPLRIGFVSGDLRHHAVASFILPIFHVLRNSTQLQLYAYHNHPSEDQLSAQLRSCTAGWRNIVNLDDAAADSLIRADSIDILIDLSGHSALNRLSLFARKPAPVQATWIGYAGTTGLRAMDYILCDQFLVPEGRYDDQFTEQIVRLPLGTPFMPDPGAPPVSPLPAQRNGYLTFGSFHRASKLSRQVIAQWAKLLHALPDARMLLGGLQSGIDDMLVGWFEQEGIARERLLLRPRAIMYDYLKQHDEVDICLSPFPYSGSTTIGHALWMGVPTLATVGSTNPSHAPAPFLTHLGLGSFITESEETYVKLAVFLSENVDALAAMRATMRERFLKSMLGYPGLTAAAMEHALRLMWGRWCAGQAPAPLRVRLSDLSTGQTAA